MITSGLVTVNGITVTELGSKADVWRDHIKVAGKLIRGEARHVYLALNKPAEVVATMSDPEGRRSLRDLLQGISERVFPVGRLDYHTSGLVLLTNDGDLANEILKAHHLQKTYQMKLKSLLTFAEVEALSRAARAHIVRLHGKDAPWYWVTLTAANLDTLTERLFQLGHPVEKVKRVAMAGVELGNTAAGAYRTLTEAEVAALRKSTKPGAGVPKDHARSAAAPGSARRSRIGRKRPDKKPRPSRPRA